MTSSRVVALLFFSCRKNADAKYRAGSLSGVKRVGICGRLLKSALYIFFIFGVYDHLLVLLLLCVVFQF